MREDLGVPVGGRWVAPPRDGNAPGSTGWMARKGTSPRRRYLDTSYLPSFYLSRQALRFPLTPPALGWRRHQWRRTCV